MRVKSILTHVFIVEEFFIMPGLNILPGFERVITNSIVKARIDNGSLELLDKPKANSEAGDMADYQSKMSAKDIPAILDLKLLEKMRDEESRPAVLKAINKQIEKLLKDISGPDKEES